MISMENIGFIVAGLTIIGLLRVLFAFRELRAELLDQRARLNSAACRIEILTSKIALADSHERRLRDLEARTAVSDRAASFASYDEATRLVQQGARTAQLTKTCGLSSGEAQLVSALWDKREGDKLRVAGAA